MEQKDNRGIIECYGICSENCTAFQNGKCVLDAKKVEGLNDIGLYKEDKKVVKGIFKSESFGLAGGRNLPPGSTLAGEVPGIFFGGDADGNSDISDRDDRGLHGRRFPSCPGSGKPLQ